MRSRVSQTDAEVGARATNRADLIADLNERSVDPPRPSRTGDDVSGRDAGRHEIDQARLVADVVRLGRVVRIERDRLGLDHGEVPTGGALHVDASASGLRLVDRRPIFAPGRIDPAAGAAQDPTVQRRSPGLGRGESGRRRAEEPALPAEPVHPIGRRVATMVARTWGTEGGWRGEPDLQAWVGSTRLNMMQALPQHLHEPLASAAVNKYAEHVGHAVVRLKELAAS